MHLAPIAKWCGGKRALLLDLRMRAPATFNRYVEPFLGGGAMYFALSADLEAGEAKLGDLNPHLIEMYQAVASDVESVIDHLELHAIGDRSARPIYYYEVRRAWNRGQYGRGSAEAAAAFLYLNKACFNGLWRVNRSGEFNVPAGRTKSPVCDPAALRAAAIVLRRASLRCVPYTLIAPTAKAGDFVYLDPPYDNTFTAYTTSGFGIEHQRELARIAGECRARGAFVMISNRRTALVESLYKGQGWTIARVAGARSMSADAQNRRALCEVIITSDRIAPASSLAQRGRIRGRLARRGAAEVAA